jgi:hypothetical protein|tara:strand:- start:1523 stop:2575 length:1053 start_codon:yes stop_codon:yes gene_type:complete
MALIGNPIDFDRIRQKYDSITYPESRRTFGNDVLNMPTLQSGFGNVRTADFRDYNNDGIDDRDQGINIPNPNVKEYFPGTPVPSGLLSNTQSGTVRQDATQPGQQVQFITNPVTGRTEMIIPEYMGTYRTDQTDFFPTSKSFESIYNTGDSEIDPTTGKLRETTEEPMPESVIPELPGGGGGFNNPYSKDYRGGLMKNNPGYENFGQLMADVKSGFGSLGTRLTDPSYSIAGPAVISSYKPRMPGLFGKVVDAVQEISLADLVGKGDDTKDNIDTSARFKGLRDTRMPDTMGTTDEVPGVKANVARRNAIDQMRDRGTGGGKPGGRSGGTAGGSAGPGGAGGRAKGGRYK